MSFKDSPQWDIGELAVGAVQRWLVRHGCYILRPDLIEMGGAPAFVGPQGRVTVPDILAASRGKAKWHEVKWKTSCVLHQVTRTWRHGVDASAWRHYLWVQNITSIPGWLSIVQLRPGPEADPEPVLLSASFDWLAHRAQSHAGEGDVKVWWEVDDFQHFPIHDLGDDWRNIDLGPRVVRPWERSSKAGVAPRWVLKDPEGTSP